MIKKFVFIVGTGRCGTKWIKTWLEKHDDIFTGPETHIFTQLNFIYIAYGPHQWLDNNTDTIDKMVKNFLIEFYSYRSNNKTVCLDHTPNNFKFIDVILRIFPDARIILPYRDGKNIIYSIKNSNWGKTIPLEAICNLWIRNAQCALNPPYPNILPVRYEDLVFHPESSRKITKHIGVEHHCDIIPWKEPINTTNTQYLPDQWKNSSQEDLEVMKMINPYLEKLNYSSI